MTEEPYRWLEAIGNRREYIREQIKGGTPVFAVSRPEGILLLGVGQGQSKVFEIYDRHAFGALGHPVDIEKIRQAAIEAAHVEGFTRSSKDVTLRRLISFALSTTLKNSFEQIFSPPLMIESIFAELGVSQDEDVLVRVHYDGNHRYETDGEVIAFSEAIMGEISRRVMRRTSSMASTLSGSAIARKSLFSSRETGTTLCVCAISRGRSSARISMESSTVSIPPPVASSPSSRSTGTRRP